MLQNQGKEEMNRYYHFKGMFSFHQFRKNELSQQKPLSVAFLETFLRVNSSLIAFIYVFKTEMKEYQNCCMLKQNTTFQKDVIHAKFLNTSCWAVYKLGLNWGHTIPSFIHCTFLGTFICFIYYLIYYLLVLKGIAPSKKKYYY